MTNRESDISLNTNADNNTFSHLNLKEKYAFLQAVIISHLHKEQESFAQELANLVQQLEASVSLITQDGHEADLANAKNFSLLNFKQHERVIIASDSQKAVSQIAEVIQGGAKNYGQPDVCWSAPSDLLFYQGIGGSAGLGVGDVYCLAQTQYQLPELSDLPLKEAQKLDAAIDEVAADIRAIIEGMENEQDFEQKTVYESYLELLYDVEIIEDTVNGIADGKSAALSYKEVTDIHIQAFSELPELYLAVSGSNMFELRERVLKALLGAKASTLDTEAPIVLVAHDLTPMDTASFDFDKILAIITEQGDTTSHAAITARRMGVPAVVGLKDALKILAETATVIADGCNGKVYIGANDEQLSAARHIQAALSEERNMARKVRQAFGRTADGQRIVIAANISHEDTVAIALDAGAEGVGLMRTEFLYLESEQLPGETEHEERYRAMAEALQGKPLIIRTLDSIKDIPSLNQFQMEKDYLGLRGIRLSFKYPDLFEPQLRAICKVAKDYKNIHLAFPMMATISDWHKAKAMLDKYREEIKAPEFPVGILIGVPAAALNAEIFAKEVDFFSIDTNDLAQYTLAMDNNYPPFTKQINVLEPAILRLIDITCAAAEKQDKWVGVCGRAAGEISAAKILVGLGVRQLSMSTNAIPTIKQSLLKYSLVDLERIAEECLSLTDASTIRQYIDKELS